MFDKIKFSYFDNSDEYLKILSNIHYGNMQYKNIFNYSEKMESHIFKTTLISTCISGNLFISTFIRNYILKCNHSIEDVERYEEQYLDRIEKVPFSKLKNIPLFI